MDNQHEQFPEPMHSPNTQSIEQRLFNLEQTVTQLTEMNKSLEQ